MRTPGELKEMKSFLADDLSDALKALFVGAIVWEAANRGRSELCPFQKDIGMYTSFVQARALYELFSSKKKKAKKGQYPDDARASDFAPIGAWIGTDSRSTLYVQYMDNESPANKRVFHLVIGRSGHAGGPINDETKHIKNQVLAFGGWARFRSRCRFCVLVLGFPGAALFASFAKGAGLDVAPL